MAKPKPYWRSTHPRYELCTPKMEYEDAYHDGEQRLVIMDGESGFNGKVILSVAKTHDAAMRKALKTLKRWEKEIKSRLEET
jgi:hypothetical protein